MTAKKQKQRPVSRSLDNCISACVPSPNTTSSFTDFNSNPIERVSHIMMSSSGENRVGKSADSSSSSDSSRYRICDDDGVSPTFAANWSSKSESADYIIAIGDRRPGSVYPIRPYADDCPFYMRNGICKYESSCRFNHPPRRANRLMYVQRAEREREKEKDGVGGENEREERTTAQLQQIQCKYFLARGGCKYGDACKYKHSFDDSEVQSSELNFIGLPIRPGEKECPYYMRHGECAYGPFCKFHHPDPTPNEGDFDPQAPIPPTRDDGDFDPQSPMPSDGTFSIPSDETSDTLEQVDNYPSQGSTLYLNLDAASSSNANDEGQGSDAVEQWVYNSIYQGMIQCQLNDKGLPLRPDQTVCRNYLFLGLCKDGAACPFHHPKFPQH